MATVNQSGEYALTLQPFPYVICAHSNANVYPVGGGHKLRYADRCINTTVEPGQQQRLDFTLNALAPVHLSGSVSGAPDGAVPVVAIYNKGREGGTALAVKSTLGGLYDFADVLPDVYTIQATAVYGDKAFFVSEEATVGAGGLANLALTLLPGIELTGSVRFKSSSGRRGRVRLDLLPQADRWNGTKRATRSPSRTCCKESTSWGSCRCRTMARAVSTIFMSNRFRCAVRISRGASSRWWEAPIQLILCLRTISER